MIALCKNSESVDLGHQRSYCRVAPNAEAEDKEINDDDRVYDQNWGPSARPPAKACTAGTPLVSAVLAKHCGAK